MPALYYQLFEVTGSANELVTDSDGLESTAEEPKTCEAVLLYVSAQAGNTVELWIKRERVAEIIDYHVDTDESSGSTNTQKSITKQIRFEVGHGIPVGENLKAGIRCGSTAANLKGSYIYTIGR
jgi:hypothetical protein